MKTFFANPFSVAGAPAQPGMFQIYRPVSGTTNFVLGLAGVLAFLVLWQLLHVMEVFPPRLLPGPWDVVSALTRMLQAGFADDILQSVIRITISFTLAAALAVFLGLLIGSFAAVSAFFSPLISGFRYLPAPAFIPLLLMWLGAGDEQKIALLFLGVVWFLVTLVADHVAGVRRELVDTARTLGATNRQILWTVIAPASFPRIWDALRQMLAVSWTYLVIAEIVAATDGIGAAMMRAQRFIRMDEVMAGILTIGILGICFDLLFRQGGRFLFRYERMERA